MALPGGRILGCGGGGGGPYAPAKLMATIYYPSPQEKPKNTKKREQESTAKLFLKLQYKSCSSKIEKDGTIR